MKTEDIEYHQAFEEVKSRTKTCKVKSRKKESFTIFLLLICNFLMAQSVEGKWTTYNEVTGSPLSVIEIVKNGKSIEGKVVQIFLEPYQGENPICSKCTGERKDKNVIDMNFLGGFKKDGTDWTDGEILDPQNGAVYKIQTLA